MSEFLIFYGNNAELTVKFEEPLDLREEEWEIGVCALDFINSIPNIYPGRDRFYYGPATGPQFHFTIPTGSYDITSLSDYIHSKIPGIKIKLNETTLKVDIETSHNIHFTPSDSIGKLLGFSPYNYDIGVISSDKPVDFQPVDVVQIQCNVTDSAYMNGKKSHTLFSIAINVPFGHRQNTLIHNPIYLPVNQKLINEMTLRLCNETGELINFQNSKIFCRLHLRKKV